MSKFNFVPRATALAAATFLLSLSAPALAVGPPVYSGGYVPGGNATLPAGCPNAGTLSTYQGFGNNGCSVGQLTFYNFTSVYEVIDGQQTYPYNTQAGAINVTPNNNPNAPGLRFSSALFNRSTATTSADYYFEYYIDPPIDILGFALDDLPFTSSYVEAAVCVGGTFGPNGGLTGGEGPPGTYTGGEGGPSFGSGYGAGSPESSCVPQVVSFNRELSNDEVSSSPQYYYFSIDGANQDSSTIFDDPDLFADVYLHVHIAAGGIVPDFGTAGILVDPSSVPEPAEWALTGLGGLVMAGALGRKRRRAKTGSA